MATNLNETSVSSIRKWASAILAPLLFGAAAGCTNAPGDSPQAVGGNKSGTVKAASCSPGQTVLSAFDWDRSRGESSGEGVFFRTQFCVAPQDEPGAFTYERAEKICAATGARIPTSVEAFAIFEKQDIPSLYDSSVKDSFYWTSDLNPEDKRWVHKLSGKLSGAAAVTYRPTDTARLRCVVDAKPE